MEYKEHHQCRVCGSSDLVPYIDLGHLPLSNNLCNTILDQAKRYPLKVLLCMNCGLSQLSVVIDPNILFGHYVYRSSINKGYVEHCRQMAIDLQKEYNLNERSFMIDIAGNDGALLSEFRNEIGLEILNIDPAINLAGICQAKGIPTLTEFWSLHTARKIVNGKGYGKADLITATNVFAHVDDVYSFIEGCNHVLKPNGVLVMEFPYLVDFIKNNEFDTIYFEHLSYFSISPLIRLCRNLGLNVMKVEKKDIHGGSVRVHIGRGEQSYQVKEFLLCHEHNIEFKMYQEFATASKKIISDFSDQLKNLKGNGKKIAGFAASAKGNTLLNCAYITCGTMSYIVDETPEKIGKYSPGTFIPIVSMLELKDNPPDYLVILSWNFKEEIIKKCIEHGYRGDFIIPIPYIQIISNEKVSKEYKLSTK